MVGYISKHAMSLKKKVMVRSNNGISSSEGMKLML